MATTIVSIAPQTDGELRLSVYEGVDPVDTATVTASIYSPHGVQKASGVPLTAVGGSSGVYTLAWQHTWTENAGTAVQGEYLVIITAVHAGLQRVRRFRIPVQFDDVN